MKKVTWTENAKLDYWQNIDYLETEWTIAVVENFLDKVDLVLNQLEKGNVIYKPTEQKDIFQIVIVKQITLYYKLHNNNITLLRFWNNHQNPTKFKY
jgi:hypothetical protein